MIFTIVERLTTAVNFVVKTASNKPYWIEITTQQPECKYYFGPFSSYQEAKTMQGGYIEDLMVEKAIGISVRIERCLPAKLTIFPEEVLAE